MASPLFAGPVGEQVVAGQVTVTRPDGQQTLIQQGSQKAVINWQNFDVRAGESVHFAQPSSSSVALNRVVGQSPTEILGVLTANGQIFLLNPNGVLFGDSAQVSVGGLIATTLQLSDDDFLAGRVQLVNGGAAGEVRNAGQISADGGYVVLAAPQVGNDGRIAASDIALAAGDKINLQLDGSRLVSVRIDAGALNAVAQNRGLIRADGGQVLLTAKAADQLIKSVVNNSGVVEAATLSNVGGRIRLEGDEVTSSGRLSARGEEGQRGGSVEMLGDRVALLDGAVVDVSGAAGGGTALIGGDYQGKNAAVQNAERTHVAATASINADARESGDGGKVIVWADGDTRYLGSISARGGDSGGNGGFVEVSGKEQLDMLGRIDVAAPQGEGGTVLLDPQDIVLNTSPQASPPNSANGTPDVAFATAPAAGTYTIQITDITGYSELYLQATNNITVASTLAMAGGNRVRFEAGNTVAINAPLTARGGVDLSAANVISNSAGSITSTGAANSNGGNITINATNNVSLAAALAASGGTNANAGNIAITATNNVTLAGNVTASGGTASGTNVGRNGGTIDIAGSAVALGAAALTASGSNGSGAAQAGGSGGAITITATNGITGTGAITASGGNGGTGAAAGGAAGSVAINNSGAGNISVGALNARTGNALTTGAGGAAGSVAVTNTAAGGNVATGAITTTGGNNGHGGSIAVSSGGNLSTGAIAASGGTANTGNAGRNAGSVTLDAGGTVTTTTIAANGSAGVGASQSGGNGANVSISSDGAITTGAISAIGGAGITSLSNGGSAGSISVTNNSTTTGAIALGALTTNSGAAFGTGAGGTAGVVQIANNAIGQNLSTGAITANGGTNSSGANVTLASLGDVTVAGLINTSGGGRGTGVTGAGTSAGAISISGVNRTVTGAITASGGAGLGTHQAGGNAGAVSITGSGTLTTAAITARAGAATGTGSGGTAAPISLAGSSVTTGALSAAGNANGHGGSIDVTSTAGNVSIGTISTAGGTAISGNSGRNAGSVTLNSAGTITASTITASGGTGVGTSQGGGSGANVQLNSDGAITTGAITAAGGAGTTSLANGGNAGSISVTNNSATTGAIALGALTSSSGAAFGAGAGGTAGAIQVSNNAAGQNLTTGAINASGGTNSSGATVDLLAQGNVTVAGLINTNGGGRGTGVTGAGNSAGAITISGVDRSVTGAITANGGAALGTNQVGGNAGAVSITGTGTLTTAAITSSTGAAIGTGAGGAVGGITLTGSSVNTGALTTTGAANGNGGDVDVTSTAGNVSVGAIAAGGGTANSGNAGRNAGSVTLTSAGSLTASAITASGGAGVGASQSGGAGGAVNITAAEAITVAAISASGGGVGASGNANGGAGGSVVLDAGGAAPTINLGGAISTAGSARRGTGVAGAGGSFWAKDATTNTTNVTVNSAGGSGGGVGGAIRFDGALNEDATARTLTLTAGTGAITLAGGTPSNALTTLTATGASNTLGSITTKGAQSYTGAISLNGALTTTGTAGADTVTFSSPVTLIGNSSVTTAGGSGDNLAIAQTVNGNFNFLLDAGLLGNVTTSAVIGGSTPLNRFSATGANVTLGRSVTANSIFARATSGDLTLNTGGTVLRGTGTGNAVELVVSGSGGRFLNNVGAAAINASNSAGRFLIWSQQSSSDVRGGVGVSFKQYAATYGVTAVADSSANNNGFLYATAPVIAVDLIGTTSKTYDGGVVAALTSGNYSFSGAIDGDSVVVSTPLAGSYADKHAGSGKAVTASGLAIDSASNGAVTVYGYTLASTSATANIGTINQRALTVTAAADSKSYDGSVVSMAAPTHAALQSGDSASFSQRFDNRIVGSGKTLTASGVVDDGNGGANYSYTFVTSTAGEITPATIRAVTGIAASDKFYDGTTDVLLNTDAAMFDGVVGADLLLVGAATGHFIDRNAGNAKVVAIRDIALAGPDAGNYLLADDTAMTTASIGARAIAVTAADSTKIYGDADPLFGFGVGSGDLVGGDTVAGVFSGALSRTAGEDVAGGPYAINQGTLVANDNYVVATFTPGQLIITPRALTIRADDKAKFAAAPLPEFTATYTGFAFADDPSNLSGALAFATAADVASVPGRYAITPYGQSASNYTITYVDGALQVFAGGVRAVDQVLSAIYVGSDWLPLVADVEPDAMGHSAVVGCSSIGATMSCSSTVYGDGRTRLTIVNGGVRPPAKLAL